MALQQISLIVDWDPAWVRNVIYTEQPDPPPLTRYPRPVTSVHQIEPTSKCQLRCIYCPSRHLPRLRGGQPAQHMTVDTFKRALEWAKHYERQGTQGELSLTGIGETLLHPEWRELMYLAREALPHNFINFSTNGILLDDSACEYLAQLKIGVFISQHRPEKAGLAVAAAREHGIFVAENMSASLSGFDWAGQLDWIDWPVSAPPSQCDWLQQGWANVLVDGRITTCCLDASAKGVVAHVDDEIGDAAIEPFELCGPCHMTVPEPGGT